MALVIAEFVGLFVTASDIFDYGYGIAPVDFLNDPQLVCPAWIVTNPPFSTACQFTLRALDLATEGVAMLVRTQWVEGIRRYEKLFRDRPPSVYAPFVERVPMVKGRWDPAATTATSYAWFVWGKAFSGPSRVFWIPPGCRGGLTLPGDRQQFAAWSFKPTDAPLLDLSEITP